MYILNEDTIKSNLNRFKEDYSIDKNVVLKVAGKEVGKAITRDYQDGEIFLTDFEIKPEFRGKGYGTLTFKELVDKYGVNSLSVNPNNTIALNMYKKFGFKQVGEPYYDENANETVIYMKKSTNESLTEVYPNKGELNHNIVYHGTPFKLAADNILKNGLDASKATITNGGGKDMPSVKGLNYLAKDKWNAIRYANMDKTEPIGYVFTFEISNDDVLPDEDSLGSLIWHNINNVEYKTIVNKIPEKLLAELKNDKRGSFKLFAEVGRYLIPKLTKEEISQIVKNTSTITTEKTLKPIKIEKIKKQDIKYIAGHDDEYIKDLNKLLINEELKQLEEVYPNKGESKEDFISRFMSATKDEYPDQKQRLAVAYSYWDRRNKKKLKEEFIAVETRPFELEDILYWYNPEDGTCSAIIDYKKKKTRVRAGLLIIKNNKVLLCKNGAHFDLPGGSIEMGETIEEAAKREAQEEVNITAKNIRETGFDYCTTNDELEDWVAENVPEKYQWYNYYTCLCIGDYSSEFKGKVDAIDKDPEMKNSADWYDIDTIVDNPEFLEPWRNALTKFGYYNKTLAEGLKDLAKDYFGETSNWKTCFYINTDGTFLDGSGRLFGSSGKSRTIDHREIADIFDDTSGNDAMLAYMKEGNIRFKPEAPGFEILIEPTEAQYKKIKSLVNSFYDNYYLDFSNQYGEVVKSNEYTPKDGLQIIDDIKDYFNKSLNEDTQAEENPFNLYFPEI